jgi:hypothetical protein
MSTCRVCLGEGKNTVNGVVKACRYCGGTGKRLPNPKGGQ